MNTIIDLLAAKNHIEIITHLNADEDAVGSSRALALALQDMDKRVWIRYPSGLPEAFDFTAKPQAEAVSVPELSVLLDVSDLGMIGDTVPGGEVVVIDHHRTNSGFGKAAWVDAAKSSTAEMVYELLLQMNVAITPAIAENLFMGIFGDTGGFMHANTTAAVFEIAADLCRRGADASAIAYNIKCNRKLVYYRLLCRAVERLEWHAGIYISRLEFEDFQSLGAGYDDAAGLVEELAALGDVELVILLKERCPGEIRGSLRSKTVPAALQTAQRFGGGGHDLAAGFTYCGEMPEIYSKIFEEGKKWAKME